MTALRLGENGTLRVRLLGPVGAAHGERVLELRGSQPRAVLSLLALRAGERLSIDELVEGIWDEEIPAQARHALHVYISDLRALLGGSAIETRSRGYALCIESERVDAVLFRTLARRINGGPPDQTLPELREALALWHGPALEGAAESPLLRSIAAGLEEQRHDLLERRLAAELELGLHAQVVGELAELVATTPLRERLRAQLMLALYRCGRQAEALECYRNGRDVLMGRLGLEPHRDLRDLEQAILRQDASLCEWGGRNGKANHAVVGAPARQDEVIGQAVALAAAWYWALRDRDETAFAAIDASATLIAEALRIALARDLRDPALRLIGSLWFYWIIRGRQAEANAWAAAALELPGELDATLESRGMIGASELARVCGEWGRAAELKEHALALSSEIEDDDLVAAALLADLAHLWIRLGDLDVAERYAQRAVELRERRPANLAGKAHALLSLAEVNEHRGELELAVSQYEQVLKASTDQGRGGEAASIRARYLGRALRRLGEFDRAYGAYRSALQEALPLRDAGTVAVAAQGLGWVSLERGDKSGAVRHLASVSGPAWQAALEPEERESFEADVARLERVVDEDVLRAAWDVGIASPPWL